MKDNPRSHKGRMSWPTHRPVKIEVWSYRSGKTMRQFHVAFVEGVHTLAQGSFRVRVTAPAIGRERRMRDGIKKK